MPDPDPRKLAQAERTLCWSVRSCLASLVVTAIALVLALLDIGGKDETLLSAIGLFVCFVGVFFSLAGLFGLALAREVPTVRPAPGWVVPASVGAIVANFALGLFGILT
jgi:uncharacterized membrane protein YidH (DUF202 family)